MKQSPPYKVRPRLIKESELEALLDRLLPAKLAQILGINQAQRQKQWYDTEQAYYELDLNSSEQLREMVRSGILRIGHEVRDVRSPDSQVPRYQFHIAKCEARLALPPEKRRIKK